MSASRTPTRSVWRLDCGSLWRAVFIMHRPKNLTCTKPLDTCMAYVFVLASLAD